MSAIDFVSKNMSWLPKPIARLFEKQMKSVPALKKMVNAENEKIAVQLEHSLKPYKDVYTRYSVLPNEGLERTKVLELVRDMAEKERPRWEEGYVSGGIYNGDKEHIEFLNQVYALHSQDNPLHGDLFPSSTKYEAEIVAMVAAMQGQEKTTDGSEIVGTVTSGGTESILLAMKTYRDKARAERGVTEPEMILPISAHVAFDKAAQYFGIKQIRLELDENFRADISNLEKLITKNTVAIVGSAPGFPHGAFDPIEAMSTIAFKHGIPFHTDCCLGGFVVPFAEKLGYNVPKVDFRLPGVTSMSVDTHKYGYAAKGTSVVLYRNEDFRHYQYYTSTEWPGGLYMSPTLAGSRPGGLSAACWATMLSVGESGYLKAVKAIYEAADKIKKGVAEIPELKIMGEPHFVIAIGSSSDSVNIYEVLDFMTKKHWNLNGLHKPACFHIALTLRQTQPGVAERFVTDLKEAVAYVKANPGGKDGMPPVYGMAASLPFRGMVSDFLKKYMDVVYKV